MEQLSVNTKLFDAQDPSYRHDLFSSRSLAISSLASLAILLLGSLSAILSSAKWGIGFFAWIAPVCWLTFFRLCRVNRKWIWFFPFITLTNIITSYDVAPFPMVALVVLGLLESLKFLVIYISDQWVSQKSRLFITTLYFPAVGVTMEFLNAQFGGGVWWSIANSQFGFKWLLQLASVTGLWGISFLMYWLASVLVWAFQRRIEQQSYKVGLVGFFGLFIIILLAGAFRYSIPEKNSRKVKIAGLSVPMMPFLENLYLDYCGKTVSIDPRISISSARLQEINKAQVPFIEKSDTVHFKNGYKALKNINDSLFILSQRAADLGAKIIVWSEANAIVFKSGEKTLMERGSVLARSNAIYLLMAVAVIHPGKIEFGTKFLENEAIFIGPDGRILNVFHKNNPVPMAEASVPGDGIIPVMETPYGKISTSICYDADFPSQMRQLSKNQTDILLLPSGDWYAIAPYHTHMALFRAVENGTSVIRQASGGLSAASDNKGRIVASMDFFRPIEKFWIAEVPVGHIRTWYGRIGDSFAYACIVLTLGGLIWGWIRSKRIHVIKQTNGG